MLCGLARSILVTHIVVLSLAPSDTAPEATKPVCRQRYIQRPLVNQRCITDTEIYINKTDILDQQHCTWLCMQDPNCQIINYNSMGAYCLHGQGPCVSLENEIDFVTTVMQVKQPCFKWVTSYEDDTYSTITFPKITGSSDLIMIVRVRKESSKIPGKKTLASDSIYYSWDGSEAYFTNCLSCEYLTLSPECTISWVSHSSTSGNPLPTGAVIGGHLKGVPLYVARKFTAHFAGHPERYSSGYYDNIEGRGHIPYGRLDVIYTDIELLVVHEWNSCQRNEIKTLNRGVNLVIGCIQKNPMAKMKSPSVNNNGHLTVCQGNTLCVT